MVLDVSLFIDGVHFGIAIYCADGWYKFEYASGLGSKGSSNPTAKVTIKRSAPTGEVFKLGQTDRSLDSIIKYARSDCGFHQSQYDVALNNCRKFAAKLADFMGLLAKYRQYSKGYFFAE